MLGVLQKAGLTLINWNQGFRTTAAYLAGKTSQPSPASFTPPATTSPLQFSLPALHLYAVSLLVFSRPTAL